MKSESELKRSLFNKLPIGLINMIFNGNFLRKAKKSFEFKKRALFIIKRN